MATRWTLRRFSSAKNDFTRSAPAFRHYKLSHRQQVKGCELIGLMKYERDGQVRWRRSATHVCLHRCSCILRNVGIGANLLEIAFEGPSLGNSRASFRLDHCVSRPSAQLARALDRKSTRLNSSHRTISYAVFCLKKKKY